MFCWLMRQKVVALLAFRSFVIRARKHLGIHQPGFHSYFLARHKDVNGKVIWEDFVHNIVHDEGEQFVLEVVFTEMQSPPFNYYIGLDARRAPVGGVPSEADNLGSLVNEPVGINGYARQDVRSDDTGFTVAQVAGEYQALTKVVTFEATGGSWGPVATVFLTTTIAAGGKLICSAYLSAWRTLIDGETLEVSMYIQA